MKKILALIMFISLLANAGASYAQEFAIVCNDLLHVREEPRMSSRSLGLIEDGTRLLVLERDVESWNGARWSHVRVEGGELEGWVYSPFITYLPRIGYVSPDTLNVRDFPSDYAPVIAQFHRDDAVEVLGRDEIFGNGGGWYYVRNLESGVEGWVVAQYLYSSRGRFACHTPILAQATPETPIAAVNWSSRTVEMQSDDEFNAPVIAELPPGTRVSIIHMYEIGGDNNQYWMQAQYGDLTGWIYSGTAYYDPLVFLPFQVDVVPPALHVRAEPGTTSAITGTLSAGTRVLVTDGRPVNGDVWFYVEYDSGSGWISADYVAALLLVYR